MRIALRVPVLAAVLVCSVPALAARPAFPLKVGPNHRHLVDRDGKPFLLTGESPQALMVNCSEAEAELFFANRQSDGFNAAWVNLLCRKGTGGREDGSTADGIKPFTKADDLSAPNDAYFARCERLIEIAAKHDTLVILDPCETIDHLKLMVSNGPEKCRGYGNYLGKRFGKFDNLLWMSGNDFQTWREERNDAAVLAVAKGIKETDKRHLHTVELDYLISGSLDDDRWRDVINVSAAYTYYPPYARVQKDYNDAKNTVPVVMIESDYEFERDSTPAILRRQEYWSLLAGAAGQLYGNGYTWPFSGGWKEKLDTPGAKQMAHLRALFDPRPWQDLVPDQKHELVTAGYGTFDDSTTPGNAYVMTSDYVTAARTADGTLAMAYLPSRRLVTVNMSKLVGPVIARWYDPSSGKYEKISDSPLPNKDHHTFTPPGNNADGDGDWVLVLETKAKQ